VFTGCALPLHSGVYVTGHFNDLATPPISLHGKAHPVNTYRKKECEKVGKLESEKIRKAEDKSTTKIGG